ncbi:MAG: hypothetical protein HY709_05230 [Candidatus Latescibacteria bacterium]|nr:hypothetical protein [Candidatus Latescibacterota bacterium]
MSKFDKRERCLFINKLTPPEGLFVGDRTSLHPASHASWRVSPDPFWIPSKLASELTALGRHLLSFYRACNTLYSQSIRGIQPAWVADYLDRGKPELVVEYGRMKRFKRALPMVIRPDIILTDDGMVITELDAVPGGIGLTASLTKNYSQLCVPLIGGREGMIDSFAAMLKTLSPSDNPTLAIVVSDEAANYHPEMEWLSNELQRKGWIARVLKPQEVMFTEDRLLMSLNNGQTIPIDILYRFFELFDLKNIPKSELIFYSAKKERVVMTPSVKSYLEEKMLFAFLFHPTLSRFWITELGEGTFTLLQRLFPQTWILDPRQLPPYGVIPDLVVDSRPATDWMDLASASQRGREFVVKPSGFSPLAWGSRGVAVGHDLPSDEWRATLEHALASFDQTPHILQKFYKGSVFTVEYYDFDHDEIRRMSGRVRLCPYYFVVGENDARLSGILATICPADKKLLHGMSDAVMVPCGIGESILSIQSEKE